MANTKISLFPQVLNNDIRQMTSIAGAGNSASASNVNVKISGSSLLNSLEALLDLSSFSTGTLPVLRGGTGATSFTNHGILIGNVSNAISATAELANGELLIGSTGNAPVPATLTAGTGVTVTNGAGSITIANSAPDQTVALTGGTGITTSGTYPNFTITNSAPDQIVALTSGTGITTSGTYPNFTITNSSPNQATPAANDGSPSTGQLQYNDGSNGFAASANLTFTGSSSTPDTLTVQDNILIKGDGTSDASKLKFNCYNNNHHVEIIGPDHAGSPVSYSIKLPNALPNVANQILESNASGALSWIATPTDTDTSIYAADGSLTGARTVTMGANNLTFNSTGGLFTIQKNLKVEGQSYGDITSVSNATVDWDNGNIQSITLPSGASTYTPTHERAGATYILKIIQPSAGDGTITWGSNVKWPGATAPTLTASNAAVDVVTLIYDGTNYLATSVLNLS